MSAYHFLRKSKKTLQARWVKCKQQQEQNSKSALPFDISEIDLSNASGVRELHSRITKYLLTNSVDRLTIQKLRLLLANLKAHSKYFEWDYVQNVIKQKEDLIKRAEQLSKNP